MKTAKILGLRYVPLTSFKETLLLLGAGFKKLSPDKSNHRKQTLNAHAFNQLAQENRSLADLFQRNKLIRLMRLIDRTRPAQDG